VAFYGGDYATALAELQKANQNDPLILIAQTYEKTGAKDRADEYYRKVLTSNAHTRPMPSPARSARSGSG
jgi:Tfp pilus assembly protein PilF